MARSRFHPLYKERPPKRPPPKAASERQVALELPTKFTGVFKPARYKVYYGGRGSAKSWSLARALVAKAAHQRLRVVCCREIQNSIGESVYALLVNQIEALGLTDAYTVTKDRIICDTTGSEFTFHGLRHNIDNIKSLEGADIVWVEEAVNVSHESWKKLVPTVRKDGSEIWVSFNPELETDETYKRFVLRRPTNAVVQLVNWQDNPWFPEVLRQEMEDLRAEDEDEYLHVYEGHCVQHLRGAVYAKELRAARTDGRVCSVPYDKARPVNVFFDLGKRDMTSLWFHQYLSLQHRFIHSYQNNFQDWPHYLEYMQRSGYVIGKVYLPHDAKQQRLGMIKSIEQQTRDAGFKVVVVPVTKIKFGISAVRTVFPTCWFDAESCADGLQALGHYRFEVKTDGLLTNEPKHDEHSHYADAFRCFAVGVREKDSSAVQEAEEVKQRLQSKRVTVTVPVTSAGWME